ncbi:ComEC/Rec2 family competence protein [Candidatus Peregrinibacteria bacterium]|nr:ComEC/Rec2 family competence protein [Candidatus Peregrinibacteria bacterium]
MSKRNRIIVFFVSFFWGVISATLFHDLSVSFILLLCASAFFSFLFLRFSFPRYSRAICFRLLFFCIFAFLFGIIRLFLSQIPSLSTFQTSVSSDAISSFVAIIVENPERNESFQKVIVKFIDPVFPGHILVTLPPYPQWFYGDKLSFFGKLESPDEERRWFLAMQGIYATLPYPKARFLASGQGNHFFSFLYFLRERFRTQLQQVLPEPQASFALGLLFGERKSFSTEMMNAFNITGLTHVLAISGYNITLIIIFANALFASLNRRSRCLLSIFSVLFFTMFVGPSASVVRAALMGIIGLFALNSGRQNETSLALAASGFFMVLWNPRILLYDRGFQLSFAATFGLIFVSPFLSALKFFSGKRFRFIKESFALTLSAMALTAPLILYYFQRFSLVSPFANIIVAPFIPLSMFFGFFAVILSFFSSALGSIFGYFAWLSLSLILFFVDWLSRIPYASIFFEGFDIWMLIASFALIGVFLFRTPK